MSDPRPWDEAWQQALYGEGGFFRTELPARHFRTNATIPAFASAVLALAHRVDEALGRPDPFDLVDLGAGGGELLAGLGQVPARWRLTGVELAEREVPFRWLQQVPPTEGLLVANEWLDSIPVQVLQEGREVLVDGSGEESLGGPVSSAWADTWWPGGGRVEVGHARDRAWQETVAAVRRGLVVAVDYGHLRATRRPTLTGYRDGRQVPPVPDGSCDLTAHVAVDSCAAATGARLVSQELALRRLGVTAALPAEHDPSYGLQLERASQARELLDPAGLGGFWWLVQQVGLGAGWMPW